MAKMFYTSAEAKDILGCDDAGLKQYAREGRLREFRDGPRLMFKADQVENLRIERGPSVRKSQPLILEKEEDDEPLGNVFAMIGKQRNKILQIAEENVTANGLPDPDAMPLHKPYEKERIESPIWDIVEQAVNELVMNQDLEVTTYPYYIVGYLVRKLEENGSKERNK